MTDANTFVEVYNNALTQNEWQSDPAQLEIVYALAELQQQLKQRYSGFRRLIGRAVTVPGLYLWGGVGRGKTWLIDLFISQCKGVDVQRFHYHQFIAASQDALTRYQGTANPLDNVAADIAEEAQLVFIDEFAVKDITDAMLLAGLLQALIREGVTVCITSNLSPDELYQGGLQRDRFLPAISLLKHHTNVIQMGGDTDYRAQAMDIFGGYQIPLSELAEQKLFYEFKLLANEQYEKNCTICVMGRDIETRYKANGLIWFDFDVLCGAQRSQRDYLELAGQFHTVVITAVEPLNDEQNDVARRFVLLIDEFYDRRVNLLMNIAVPLDRLYTGDRLSFEYQRTISRLTEMQSDEYRRQAHRI